MIKYAVGSLALMIVVALSVLGGISAWGGPPAAQPSYPAAQSAAAVQSGADAALQKAGVGAPMPGGSLQDAVANKKPFRTFVHVQRFNMEQSGDVKNPISNVRLKIEFPNKNKLALPEGNQWWPIGNGQVQEINRTYEIPFAFLQNDGFKFQIQWERKGDDYLPCNFDVVQLSEFNRAYVCHTDLTWQQNQNIPAEKQDKEGIQVRVFTDKNAEPKEIPTDAIALK